MFTSMQAAAPLLVSCYSLPTLLLLLLLLPAAGVQPSTPAAAAATLQLLRTCYLSAALNEEAVCLLHDVGLVQR
jgi:hypothetical protein